mgnify:CR=1 FL=1
MALAIFAKQGWQDKLVHLDYNNRLDRNNPVKSAEQTVSVVEGTKKFKFVTTRLYDCQKELEAAIEFARQSPFPDPATVEEGMWAE